MSLNLKRWVAKTAHSGWQLLKTLFAYTWSCKTALFRSAISEFRLMNNWSWEILYFIAEFTHEYCNQMLLVWKLQW